MSLRKVIEDAAREAESGWLIERWINNELRYWSGRGGDGFEADHNEAVRFAREQDAMRVLSWWLDGRGRVAEHIWRLQSEEIAHD